MYKYEVYCDGEYIASYWVDEGFQAIDKAKIEFPNKIKGKAPYFEVKLSPTH